MTFLSKKKEREREVISTYVLHTSRKKDDASVLCASIFILRVFHHSIMKASFNNESNSLTKTQNSFRQRSTTSPSILSLSRFYRNKNVWTFNCTLVGSLISCTQKSLCCFS